jgi:hypothetical protein
VVEAASCWWAAWADDLGSAAMALRLAGGTQDGRRRPWPALRERAAPTAERACFLPGALGLCAPSSAWADGGELAWDPAAPAAAVPVLGRAWRLGRGQVSELLRQLAGDPELPVAVDSIVAAGRWELPGGAGTVVALPPLEGVPLLALATRPAGRGALAPAQLYHWVLGLVETYHFDQRGLRRHLQGHPWVVDHYDGPSLNDLYRTVRDELGQA